MASPTQWTWVWASSRRWWRTGMCCSLWGQEELDTTEQMNNNNIFTSILSSLSLGTREHAHIRTSLNIIIHRWNTLSHASKFFCLKTFFLCLLSHTSFSMATTIKQLVHTFHVSSMLTESLQTWYIQSLLYETGSHYKFFCNWFVSTIHQGKLLIPSIYGWRCHSSVIICHIFAQWKNCRQPNCRLQITDSFWCILLYLSPQR